MQRGSSQSSSPPRFNGCSSGLEQSNDWSGINDSKMRRKLQNRLNQRAYRQRRHAQSGRVNEGRLVLSSDNRSQTKHPSRWLSIDETESLIKEFSESSFRSYARGSPTADHLIILSKLNVYRAFIQNLSIIGITPHRDWISQKAISPFNTRTLEHVDNRKLPDSLRPTQMQCKILHHPWLDFFPFRRMRENLIAAGDALDDGQLCIDIMGFWDISTKNCNLLVWGEPSEPGSWEVTEEFLRKWPWVLHGVPELIESTNYWRNKRGENIIFRYI
ncbi:Protein of unknown function DUF3425 [Penicillium canescens]|nr:Protein of unknown function DUF3425 [Penicillium canescens]KAJ6177091.1 Protein of unknown function DUF3425 [Penicillium canescens]